MYLPAPFTETRLPVLHRLIRESPLGTWIVVSDGEPVANPVPFLLDPARGDLGTLSCHVARQNPIVGAGPGPLRSLVCFQGPQAYVTPTWYPGKARDGRVVPTWNYVVVQARGDAVFIDDPDWLRRHVTRLTDLHEAQEDRPWAVGDAPADYIERMIAGVVGIEIRIDGLAGKWKLSQNRNAADRRGVLDGLSARGDDAARSMCRVIESDTPPAR
jgi:transcriptional regulator